MVSLVVKVNRFAGITSIKLVSDAEHAPITTDCRGPLRCNRARLFEGAAR